MASTSKRFLLNFPKVRKKRPDELQDHGSVTLPDARLSVGRKSSNLLLSPGSSEMPYGLSHSSSTGDLYCASAGTSPMFDDALSSENDTDMETILLAQHLQRCARTLVTLKSVVSADVLPDSENKKWEEAQSTLDEVVRAVTNVIRTYPSIDSADILSLTSELITRVKACSVNNSTEQIDAVSVAIDTLSAQLTNRCMQLAEHVITDMLIGSCNAGSGVPKAKSLECVMVDVAQSPVNGHMDDSHIESDSESGLVLDEALHKLDSGVEMALHRAQAWSKFAKDLVGYIEKRTNLWNEFTRNLAKIAKSLQQTINEDSYLPFHSVFSTAVCQDEGLSGLFADARSSVNSNAVIAPLNARRVEHDKVRKNLKSVWIKQLNKMHEAVSNMRKAKSLYISRHQEYDKIKEQALRAESELATQSTIGSLTATKTDPKIEKRKKQEDEALQKAVEAEAAYKACIESANLSQQQSERVKTNILREVRELINESDRILKLMTLAYFDIMKEATVTIPLQFRALCEASNHYVPGSHYANYVRHLRPADNVAAVVDTFTFEPYNSRLLDCSLLACLLLKALNLGHSVLWYREFSSGSFSCSPDIAGLHDKSRSLQALQGEGDSDDMSAGSSISRESSPSASPFQSHHQTLVASFSAVELDRAVDEDSAKFGAASGDGISMFHGTRLSYAAQTHVLRKVHTPSRCAECDQYVYFQGAECETCGIAAHKKCLEILRCTCSRQQGQHHGRLLGSSHSSASRHSEVPHLVKKCIAEIDKRGLDIKGIYRLSGVKSRVDQLCHSFDTDERSVALAEHHPNVIANVLKLYFRQLPEPLLTFDLYPELIQLAREELQGGILTTATQLSSLSQMLEQLPNINRKTLAALIRHLNRVASHQDVNQMTASNLGIVFGPTLLRPREGASSLNYLIETPFQTRIIELLIENVDTLFGSEEIAESSTRTEMQSHSSQIQSVSIEGGATRVTVRTETSIFQSDMTSPGITSWYAPEMTKDLLQELAKEEPHFQQVLQDTGMMITQPVQVCTDDVMKQYEHLEAVADEQDEKIYFI